MGISGRSFIPFGSRIGILDGFFVSFGSWIGILTESFVSFGSRIVILDGFLVSFVSWMGIPGRSFMSSDSWIRILDGFFVSFGSWIGILAEFLLLRARSKSDLYRDRLISYRCNAALYGFGYMVTSRNSSFFLSLMKEKNQKKIKAMIAIYFCLVHVIHGRCLVRLGEGRTIFVEEMLLCTLYMRKSASIFFRLCLVFVSKTCSNFGAMKRRESLPI